MCVVPRPAVRADRFCDPVGRVDTASRGAVDRSGAGVRHAEHRVGIGLVLVSVLLATSTPEVATDSPGPGRHRRAATILPRSPADQPRAMYESCFDPNCHRAHVTINAEPAESAGHTMPYPYVTYMSGVSRTVTGPPAWPEVFRREGGHYERPPLFLQRTLRVLGLRRFFFATFARVAFSVAFGWH